MKEHKVVVKEMINADTTISVYDHGYVLYTAGGDRLYVYTGHDEDKADFFWMNEWRVYSRCV